MTDGDLSAVERALAGTGLDAGAVRDLVARALDEDLGGDPGRDVTSEATIDAGAVHAAHVVARAGGVVAGLPLLGVVLADVARRQGMAVPSVELRAADGDEVARGDVVARLLGATRVLLVAERTLLNLLCRASGVATSTRQWVQELEGTGARVLDTRKTTPGLRSLEKYAVRCGGGTNKRMGLYDVAMVKDNHKLAAGSVAAAYAAVRSRFPGVDVQVEVTTPAEAVEAVGVGARFLLCDNMSVEVLADTVRAARAATGDRLEIEATGGLSLAVARDCAATGVDYLSVGALTHSSGILDLAVDLSVEQAVEQAVEEAVEQV